ncbi:MAG: hypothetical protein R3B57_03025 [Phycisphaerales bacterium]
MGTRLSIRPPEDYLLARDVCSYGYFVLEPNHWDVGSQTLRRILDLGDGPAGVLITQGDPAKRGDPLSARFDRALSTPERREAKAQIARMLRLDEDAENLRQFHALDPRWKKSGRGRLYRSPTLFEDVIKTVTSCNVTWPSTVGMNRRLCEALGRKAATGSAFPSPEKVARTRVGTLRGRCRVGYRDQRIKDLGAMFAKGEIDEGWLTDPGVSDDEVFKFLKTLPGIGPYAAANVMQLIGRYSRLALDSESLRHAKTVLGMKGSDAQLMKRLTKHYDQFGDQRFRSYWFELWTFYEDKKGEAHSWERETTGKSFTASQL